MNLNRREFLEMTAAGAAGMMAQGTFGEETQKPLRVALIGCGGRGTYALLPSICAGRPSKMGDNGRLAPAREQIAALVDPDSSRIKGALARIHQFAPAADLSKIRTFSDYRAMFKEMDGGLDAVMIATPNHQHALPALMAIRRKINVYVEKPMTLTMAETRQLMDEAKKYGVATQMGQHGHSNEGVRRLCEYVWSGAIGQIHEAYSWDDRVNSLTSPRPAPSAVPKVLNWDEWIGPAPFRAYHTGLHPHDWHSWIDFGNGSIGNMGNHVLDSVFWALKLTRPQSVELLDFRAGTEGTWPVRSHVCWKYPAREGMDPVSVHWYDGIAGDLPLNNETADGIGIIRKRENRNMPPAVLALEKKYGVQLTGAGSVLIGEKGVLAIGPFGEDLRFVPDDLRLSVPRPPKTIPRITGSHQTDFFRACRGGVPACANFEYSGRLSEMILLADVAMRAGAGRIDWDSAAMRCTNRPEVNQYLSYPYRAGWKA